MDSINEFLKRSSNQCGFERMGYIEKNMPTSFDDLLIIPFFGDIKSTLVMSSLLMNQYKIFKNKYLILCSWNDHKALYPYVDEFWQLKDHSCLNKLALHAENFNNTSDVFAQINRSLITRFENVISSDELKSYYDFGFQKNYWDAFGVIKKFSIEIPSPSKIDKNFVYEINKREGKKIVLFPSLQIKSRNNKKTNLTSISKDFWIYLTNALIDSGITPVIYQNYQTYDLSKEFAEKCIYLVSKDIAEVLSCMRYVGCVLDVHNGISRYAIMARCPFICVDERLKFVDEKEYEIDDLFCLKIPKQYIFSFSSFVLSNDSYYWGDSIVNNIISKIHNFIPQIDSNSLESTNQSEVEISYDIVRERKMKRLGLNFIKKY